MEIFDECFQAAQVESIGIHGRGRRRTSRMVSMTLCAIAVLTFGFAVTTVLTVGLFVLLVLS